MPELVPLTATPPAQLDFSRPGTPASTQFDDIYFSVDGGLDECRDVYLRGCGLPERWQGREDFTIAELGFGTGLNFLAALEMWAKHRPSETARLHFISVEGFPLSKAQLERAYSDWDEMPSGAREMIAAWPDCVKGVHHIAFENGVRLTLIHDAVEPALQHLDFAADAWFLDGFSPSKNPDMWSEEILKRVYDLSSPGCRVGTFTVAGDVRRGLAAAGFEVSKQPGFGRKRERLEAIKPGAPQERKPKPRVAIIGAGIAGLMTAVHLRALGVDPVLYHREGDIHASGNPCALVKPRLDILDRPEARFFNAAYLYALQTYAAHCVTDNGIYHIARTVAERVRFRKLDKYAQLPARHMHFIEAPECDLHAPYGAMLFPHSIVVDPIKLRRDVTKDVPGRNAQITKIESGDGGAALHFSSGDIETFDDVVICAGQGVARLVPDLDIRFQRGQITKVKTDGALTRTKTYGGYAIPGRSGTWLGATHDPHDSDSPAPILKDDDFENIEKFAAFGGQVTDVLDRRASVRVTTPRTLPIAGRISKNIYCISGLGGRGFIFAPLLGLQIAAQICGTPPVIAKDMLTLLKPKMTTP